MGELFWGSGGGDPSRGGWVSWGEAAQLVRDDFRDASITLIDSDGDIMGECD